MTRIDVIFKGYAVEKFGDVFSDVQIEEARCFAFNRVSELTRELGKQPKGTTENLFLEYLANLI